MRTGSHFTKWFAIALAIVNAAFVGVYVYRLRRLIGSAFASGAEILWDTTITLLRIRIAVALIVAAAGLLIRRRYGAVASVVCLIWAIGEYVRWAVISRQIAISSGVESAGFFGLSYANLILFACTILLLFLVVRERATRRT